MEKTFAGGSKTAKFVNVFPSKFRFSLYDIIIGDSNNFGMILYSALEVLSFS